VISDLSTDSTLGFRLADAVLVVHFAIAAFVVGGLVLVTVGNLKHWSVANNVWFRLAHLVS